MLASYALQLGILVMRGPHCPRNHWFGWVGGFEAHKSVLEARKKDDPLKAVATNSIDELQVQPPEKVTEGGLVRFTNSGDAANIV